MLIMLTGPLPSVSPGIDRYEIVLSSVANSDTPTRIGFMLPEPTKYS